MLSYEKLSRSTRTRTALLLLLLFMVLAVVDLFISFFGGLVLGVLLVQFEWEAHRFLKRTAGSIPRLYRMFTGISKRYLSLSRYHKLLLKAALLALVFILMLSGVLHTFWGGLLSGILLVLLLHDVLRYQQQQGK